MSGKCSRKNTGFSEPQTQKFPSRFLHNASARRAACSGWGGIRESANSPKETPDSKTRAAKSAAIDPKLAKIIAAWPTLPAALKAAILSIADSHTKSHKPKGKESR
jgi:hypothetical protein